MALTIAHQPAALQTLGPQAPAAAIEVQDFDLIGAPVDEAVQIDDLRQEMSGTDPCLGDRVRVLLNAKIEMATRTRHAYDGIGTARGEFAFVLMMVRESQVPDFRALARPFRFEQKPC